MRFIVAFLISMLAFNSANAGVLKWGLRGAGVCALNTACRGIVSGKAIDLSVALISRYGAKIANSCLQSPQCKGRALEALSGIAAGALGWEVLDSLLSEKPGNDRNVAENGPYRSSQAGTSSPPPEDGDDDEGEPEFAPQKKNLQHAFSKHGSDWGYKENWNNATAKRFQADLESFMQKPDTLRKVGTYRGKLAAVHYYNPETRLWLSKSPADGNLLATFRISPDQLANLIRTGNVQ